MKRFSRFIILASALTILGTPALAASTKHHHKTHAKVAQGPAGLNFGGAPASTPQFGTATGVHNPISGSSQDPGLHKPLAPPALTPRR
jgi:hypothetical protein